MPFEHNTINSYFSRNMEDVVFTTSDKAARIVVGINEQEFDVALVPLHGSVTLRTAEIVSSMVEDYNPHIEDIELVQEPIANGHIYAFADVSGSALSFNAINGGYNQYNIPDENEFMLHNFLTWRPQTIPTTHGIKEQLTVASARVASNLVIKFDWKIYLRMYFKMHVPATIHLENITTANALCRIDVSADRIAAKAADAGFNDEIIAYDIYGTLTVEEWTDLSKSETRTAQYSNAPCVQRFIVVPPSANRTYFFFQNTLGGFDTIAATGIVKSSAKGDIKAVINHRIEKELENDFVESWEVNTGYIATAQEKNHWHEFLRATNRYVLLPDRTYRRIIIDDYKAEHTSMQLGSFTFTYHYSTPDNGRSFARQELDSFENHETIWHSAHKISEEIFPSSNDSIVK